MDTSEMTRELITISRQAGEAILEYYKEEIGVDYKEDDSPLTAADISSHHTILEGLLRIPIPAPFVSEEGYIDDYEKRKEWESFWLIDPLDGTKEFLKRNGEFTVNIALIENGVPVLGVVHLPAKGVTYSGSREHGSWRYDKDPDKPLRIFSNAPDRTRPLRVITSRSHGTQNVDKYLAKQGIKIGEQILAGSSLKFCYVAEGRADIYARLGTTMEWDTAAGDAVYRYSGREGERASTLRYNKPDLMNDKFIIGL